jgi:hypothetical protein
VTKQIIAIVAVLVLIAAVLVGGYLGGWWLRKDVTNRDAEIRRCQYEVQETARDEIIRQSVAIEAIDAQLANPDLTSQQGLALQGQQTAMITQLCNVASSICAGTPIAIDNTVIKYCGYSPNAG